MKIVIIDTQALYATGLASTLVKTHTMCQTIFSNSLTTSFGSFDTLKAKINLIVVALNSANDPLINQIQQYLRSENCAPVMILTSHDDPQRNSKLLQAGVSGIISKFCSEKEILEAIQSSYLSRHLPQQQVKQQAIHCLKTNKKPMQNLNPENTEAVTLRDDNSGVGALRVSNLNRNSLFKESSSRTTPYKPHNLLHSYRFEFNISADEEHAFLQVRSTGKLFDFKERAHHYLLLTLARLKQQDYQNGYDKESQGWVNISDLQKMLGIDTSNLNIQIFRARQQINSKLSSGEQQVDIFQRRSGGIRLACCNYSIYRSGQLESHYQYLSPVCKAG